MGFSKKILNFFKVAKGSKVVVECNWKWEYSQSAQNLRFSEKKLGFWTKNWNFLKIAEGSNFGVEGGWTH